ncbi:MAG: ABC transporter ATP-binding protein, partial [Deltaproteobacteria bacterium]|nr:ABC transporter ATP-binding protein [Deltaproteobacteria bacterium]
LTYIVISHDLAVVEHLASRVAVMYLGRIVEEATTKEIFKRPRHPYTQALLTSVLTPEPRLGLPETHLGIAYPNPIDPPPGCTFHPRCPKATERCRTVAPEPVVEGGRLVECFYPDSL